MIIKPEKVIKRIIKAVGQKQPVLIIGDWQEELIKGIKENQNSLTQITDNRKQTSELQDNSFTRIIADYSSLTQLFFNEARRLLLPTGQIIITAITNEWYLERIIRFIKRIPTSSTEGNPIKPKILQDMVHDNGFLIEAYNGYPNGQMLMIAQIINKEVSTLYSSNKQETLTYN